MAAADHIEIRVEGKGAHAALPHDGVDTIVVATTLVQALQSIVSRNLDPIDQDVVSITQFHAGDAFNVIPPLAELAGIPVDDYTKGKKAQPGSAEDRATLLAAIELASDSYFSFLQSNEPDAKIAHRVIKYFEKRVMSWGFRFWYEASSLEYQT